jgi:hypothetical protein
MFYLGSRSENFFIPDPTGMFSVKRGVKKDIIIENCTKKDAGSKIQDPEKNLSRSQIQGGKSTGSGSTTLVGDGFFFMYLD